MIKASELRIGNHAYQKYWNPHPENPDWAYEMVTIVGVLKDTFYFRTKNDKRTVKIGELHPIPLSEGLLVAVGFENDGLTWCLRDGVEWSNGIFKFTQSKWQTAHFPCEYFHQLQNLFYFLTCGEELSFDLSLVGAVLNQPPAAEAIRGADSTATQDEKSVTNLD